MSTPVILTLAGLLAFGVIFCFLFTAEVLKYVSEIEDKNRKEREQQDEVNGKLSQRMNELVADDARLLQRIKDLEYAHKKGWGSLPGQRSYKERNPDLAEEPQDN